MGKDSEVEAVFYIDFNFIDGEGFEKGPGWYFRDEEGDTYGPFLDKAHGERALQLYLKQLEQGVAPTQLRDLKITDWN